MDDPVAVWRSHNYFHPFFVRFVTLLFHLEAALWSFQGNNIVFSGGKVHILLYYRWYRIGNHVVGKHRV